jgi:serine kinase of HPr protein (carbohydrate metabolism regulator)
MLEPIPFAGMVEIDESFDRTAIHMACEFVSNTKPVAYAMFKDGEYYDAIHPDEQAKTVGEYDIPLYTHPVKELTPLTEDECRAIIEKHNWFAKSWAEMAMEIQDAILRKAQEK